MPSQLNEINWSYAQAESELEEFKTFLQRNEAFAERDVVALLKSLEHLSCLIGTIFSGVPRPNRFKFEFQILGAFVADLVVGSLPEGRFVLVEFEGGERNSLFGPKGTTQMRDWSRQLEHGFSQVVDWAWAKDGVGNNQIFNNAFDCNDVDAMSLVVCGRDRFMDETEQKRFAWRRRNISVGGRPAEFLTYDGLLLFFENQIAAMKSLVR